MNLESPKVVLDKSAEETFNFLSDIKNFEKLMPENISKFEVLDTDKFLFALKGMPEIALELKEVNSPIQLKLGAISDKIPFTLIGNIEAINEQSSDVSLQFEGNFKPMMAMMIKGPITKFIETLSSNLENL